MTTSMQAASKQRQATFTHPRARPRGDFQALEQRRMRAADLFEQGVISAEVARRVGVSHQIVSEWRAAWQRAGRAALRGAGRAGRRPKITDDQRAQVESVLAQGAEANGYTADLWTLPRVAEVIERVTGQAYHPGHVWHILREQLGWTWQRPARRAVERDDEAIARWVKQRWPQIKSTHGGEGRHRAS